MSEREPSGFACESCGKDFSEHLGLTGTCRQLTAAQQRVAELEQENKRLNELCEIANAERRRPFPAVHHSSKERWTVAIIPCGRDITRIESFAHWHCHDPSYRMDVVVPESKLIDLTADNARLRELLRECGSLMERMVNVTLETEQDILREHDELKNRINTATEE